MPRSRISRALCGGGIAAVLGVCAAQAAPAPKKSGCEKFTWPVTRELEWFAQDELPKIKSGATRPALPDGAFVLDLDSDENPTLFMPPERKPRSENSYGGAVSFGAVPRAGVYQVSLSEDGLIDVIQGGKYLRKQGSGMRRDCIGVRRNLRVELAEGPLVLQLGGVDIPFLRIAVTPVEDGAVEP